MALSIPTLSAAMKTEIEANFAWPIFDPLEVKKLTDAISKAVIEHIQASAELSGAVITSPIVTVDPGTHIGSVTSPAVSGGIA